MTPIDLTSPPLALDARIIANEARSGRIEAERKILLT
jgi:hypothetical protein